MKLRPLLRKLGISCAALVAFFVAAELAARLAEPGPMSLYDRSPYRADARLSHVHEPGFRGRWDSSWYAINSHGWRGPEVEPTFAEDEFRVVALGDSCTFGKGVLEADTWPRQLEGLLRDELGPDRKPLVFNLGVNGYSLWQYERVLEAAAPVLRPDLVIIGYNVNDYDSVANEADKLVFGPAAPARRKPAAPAAGAAARAQDGEPPRAPEGGAGVVAGASGEREHPPDREAQGSSLRGTLRALMPSRLRDELNRLALYRFLRATYYEWSRERDYDRIAAIVGDLSAQDVAKRERALEREGGFLSRLVATSRASGAKVAIFLFPFEAMVVVDGFDREPERFVRELAARQGVAFVDVPQAFRERLRAPADDPRLFIRGDRYHPNADGYEVVARTLLADLKEQGLLAPRE